MSPFIQWSSNKFARVRLWWLRLKQSPKIISESYFLALSISSFSFSSILLTEAIFFLFFFQISFVLFLLLHQSLQYKITSNINMAFPQHVNILFMEYTCLEGSIQWIKTLWAIPNLIEKRLEKEVISLYIFFPFVYFQKLEKVDSLQYERSDIQQEPNTIYVRFQNNLRIKYRLLIGLTLQFCIKY